jgi:toxin ParE1/3/4
MDVRVTQPAIADLQEIEEYISSENIAAAGRMIQKLKKRCLALGNHPNIGHKRDYIKSGLRTISEGNYIIFTGDPLKSCAVCMAPAT